MRKLVAGLALAVLLSGCQMLPPAPEEAPETKPEVVATASSQPELPEVELDPDLLFQLLLAEIAGQRGEVERSAVFYLRAAYDTGDPRLARRATQVAIYARDFALAMRASEAWVNLAPKNLEAHQSRAALLIRAGRTEEAVAHLEAVLAMSEQVNGHGFMLVANLLQREQDRQRALTVMDRLVESRQDDPHALYAYARLASTIGEPEQALETLDTLLERRPDWGKAVALKADVMHGMGRADQALELYRRGVELEPDNTDLRLAYARLLVEEKKLEDARSQFKELAERMPDNANVAYALGLLALRAGDLDHAEEQFGKLFTSGERTDEAAFSLGQIAEQRDHWDEAIKWYTTVDEQGDRYLDARIRVAVILAQEQTLEKARDYLDRVKAKGPDEQVRLMLVEGELLREHGQPEAAMEVYTRALERFPDNPEVLYARAMVAERLDRLDRLEGDLRRILAADPDNTQALNALGYTLADRTERHREAYELIQKAYEQAPDDAAIIDSMGWVLYRMGQEEEALEHLRRAYRLRPDGEIAAHLIEVLWQSGRRDEAREVAEQARERFPGHELLEEVVQRLLP